MDALGTAQFQFHEEVPANALLHEETPKTKAFPPTSAEGHAALLAAKTVRSLRASRGEFLPGNLFSDPAWDILLTLFIAHGEQFRLTVSSLVEESRVPSTTCLRWIDALVKAGMAKRLANPVDARSSYIELTSETAERMFALLFASRI